MNNIKTIAIGGAAGLVIIAGIIYTQLDNWFDTSPTGPGSGDLIDQGNGPGEPGPGSGEVVIPGDPNWDPSMAEPTGPGSGDEVEPEPTGPGSGDEVDPNEPTGPGSGDEVEPEPTGPGSGDEVDPNEPTGPGSGDEYLIVGSCNHIAFGSTCVDYVGSFWESIKTEISSCSGTGTWSQNPCPTDYLGGCNQLANTAQENTIWHYSYGGDPFMGAAIQAAIQACTMSPMGSWVMGS